MRQSFLKSLSLAVLACFCAASVRAADPLPSWKEGAAKQSITAFVEKVTKAGSPDFVPPAARDAPLDRRPLDG